MLQSVFFAAACLGAVASLSAEGPAGHWPQWRGPNRDNRSLDTGLLKTWPPEGPPLEWSVAGVGEGIGSVSVDVGRVFTMGHIEANEYVTALDERTGERIWTTPIGPTIGAVENNRLMRWLSQRTPTVDGDRLYAVRSDAQLVCLASDDGRELWRKDFAREFGTGEWNWGFCDRPLVDGDLLIVTPGGSKATIAALDKVTGEVRWQSLVDEQVQGAYAALVVAEFHGIRQYIAFLSDRMVGIATDDRRVLWKYTLNSNATANSHTPLVLDDGLLVGGGYGRPFARLTFVENAGQHHWQEAYRGRSRLNVFHDTSLIAGGRLYCFSIAGALECVDVQTGDELWQSRGEAGDGMLSFTWADDHLYVRNSDGTVVLAEVGADRFAVKGKFSIPDHVESIGATFPVVTGGRLYLRDDNHLFCHDVRESAVAREAPERIVLTPPADSTDQGDRSGRPPKPIFVPTPEDVVAKMLELANVQKDDLVVDLGSGDGRIVIAAARDHGCQAVGYELDAQLVRQSRARIEEQKVGDLATIEERDMYSADLAEVDVVAVYVYASALEKMKSQFEALKPGARIVSHFFEIPGIKPDKIVEVESEETGQKHRIILYRAPLVEAE